MKALALALALMLVSSAAAMAADAADTFNSIAEARNTFPQELVSLNKEPTWQLLRKVFYDCMKIPENRSSPTWASDRDFKLVSLCGLLTVIDKLQDPSFDPNNTGVSITAPVPPNSGIIPGEDPSAVKDPALRAQYVQLIDKNNIAEQYASLQIDLIRVRSDCTKYTMRYIRSRYTDDERNTGLKQLIQQTLSNDPKSADIVSQLLNVVHS